MVYTRFNAASLQRESERIELVMRVGEATRYEAVLSYSTNSATVRWNTWKANFTFTVVTQTKPNDNKHGLWRAIIRNIAAQLCDSLNNDNILPYHRLDEIIELGTTPSFRGQDGYEASALVYSAQISLKADAWPKT